MPLDLNSVDLSAVDALVAIKAEQDQLADRLKAMASKREQVSSEVFKRVEADYRNRLNELAAQAAPLILRAGTAYRGLREELVALEKAFALARLDREEIDFRHALGEFDATELANRVKLVDAQVAEHGKARTQALELKVRFLAVVAGESELEASDDDTAQMNAITPETVVAAPVEPSVTVISAPIRPQPVSPRGALENAATLLSPPASGTPTVSSPTTVPLQPAPTAAPASSPGTRPVARSQRNPDATVVFRQGRLEPRNAEAGSVVQTLGLKPVSVGSDGSCDLQLMVAGVAKKHVEITMTRAGFSVRDFAASGTVKVNGAVIQEHVLAEGDTLSVGPAQFNFRLL